MPTVRHIPPPKQVETLTIRGKAWTLRTTPMDLWVRGPGVENGQRVGGMVVQEGRELLVQECPGDPLEFARRVAEVVIGAHGGYPRKGAK